MTTLSTLNFILHIIYLLPNLSNTLNPLLPIFANDLHIIILIITTTIIKLRIIRQEANRWIFLQLRYSFLIIFQTAWNCLYFLVQLFHIEQINAKTLS